MRKSLRNSASVLAVAMGVALSVQSARAADAMGQAYGPDWYVSLFGGASFARANASYDADVYDIELNDGFSVGAAIGNHLGNGYRVERELSYVHNGNDNWSIDAGDVNVPVDGSTSAIFGFANLWKDIDLGTGFQPHVGGGLGVGLLSSDGFSVNCEDDDAWNDTSVGLAGQLGAGLRVAVSDRVALDAGYRLRAVIDASFNGDPTGEGHNGAFSFYSHSAQLGLSYALGDGAQIMPSGGDSPGWYVSLFGGGVFPEKTALDYQGTAYWIDHKTGFTIGGAIATHLLPGLRTELELSYARAALDSYSSDATATGSASGHLEQGFLLANIWKDFDFGMLTPYVGGGLGFGTVHFDDAILDDDSASGDTGYGLAGQFGFGARMAVSDNVSVDLGYRFKSVVDALITGGGDFENGNESNYDVATHNHVAQIGLNYGLGEGATAPEPMTVLYVSLFGGAVFAPDTFFTYNGQNYLVDYKTGFTVGAAVGGNLTENLRGEIELAYQTYDVTGVDDEGVPQLNAGSVESYFLLANLWRDFDIAGFKPYMGGGLGLTVVDVDIIFDAGDNDFVSDSTLALAAQAGSGVRFALTDALTLDAGYRFKAAVGVFTGGSVNSDNDDHAIASHYAHVGQLGVSWKF